MSPAWGGRLGIGGSLAIAVALGLCLVVAVAAGGSVGGRKPPRASPTPTASTSPSMTPSLAPGEGVVTGRVGVSPITLGLELSQRAARAGQPVQVWATIVNEARQTRSNIAVTLVAAPAGVSLRPQQGRIVGRLGPGDSEVVTWIACASPAGTYAFVATATVDGTTITSAQVVLTVNAGGSC